MTTFRMKLAYIVAPTFPTLYMLVMPYLTGSSYTGRYDVFLVLFFSLSTSYLSCFFLAHPFVKFLKKGKCLSLVNVVVGGAVLGMLANYIFGYAFSAFLGSSMSGVSYVNELIWGAIMGVSVALPFSLIAGLPFFHKKKTKE